MKKRFAWVAGLILLTFVLGGCECGDPKAKPPAGFTPNFEGTWQLTDPASPAKAPVIMTLRRSNEEKPSSPGGIFMTGKYGKNAMVRGTASGSFFVGTTRIYGFVSSAPSITMEMVASNAANALYRTTTPLNAVKIGP
jgi:hypothetical protein